MVSNLPLTTRVLSTLILSLWWVTLSTPIHYAAIPRVEAEGGNARSVFLSSLTVKNL